MAKLTARVDDDTYNTVMPHLHYGQQTALMKAIFESLAKLIDEEDGLGTIAQFIAKTAPITLNPIQKKKEMK